LTAWAHSPRTTKIEREAEIVGIEFAFHTKQINNIVFKSVKMFVKSVPKFLHADLANLRDMNDQRTFLSF